MFDNKIVVVFGGTGSLGSKLVRALSSGIYGIPKQVKVFSRDEAKQHELRISLCDNSIVNFCLGDIRNPEDVALALVDANIVINTSALKQVTNCETNPMEAIKTNCFGTWNIVTVIKQYNYPVDIVLGISTDKACNPINVMGMTKSIQERILINSNHVTGQTKYINVRYGNILGSRSSVIPYFINLITKGMPITITDRNMTRFFLSIDQAIDIIITAISEAKPGEIYIPLTPSVSIMNLAKALIGSNNIELKIQGIRPGEKVHENLISDYESRRTIKRGKYYVIQPEGDNSSQAINNTSFCSKDHLLNFQQTIDLLRTNNFIIPSKNQLSVVSL